MKMCDRIQFVFCKHSSGHLAFEELVQHQPPLGLLFLASYIKQIIPAIEIEVLDEVVYKESFSKNQLDADIIGFSVWFTNYERSLRIAEKIKNVNPNTIIIFGGPHATALGKKILLNNPFINYIIIGEGEIPFLKFLKGENPETIKGLYGQNQKDIDSEFEQAESINLNELPLIDLSLLKYQYAWETSKKSPSMSAFPLSGIRGCNRYKIRCEYCSIPFNGYRFVSAENYWQQIETLFRTYGIDYFFETGDIFSKYFLRELLKGKKVDNVNFRIYGYPNLFHKNDIKSLKYIGVKNVYMGIESVLHWHGSSKRKYGHNYKLIDLIEEIITYQGEGVEIIPGILLGLPGENENTLKENIELINKLRSVSNVREISINVVLPLPGTDYFQLCLKNETICTAYYQHSGIQLRNDDIIDYALLTKLFIDYYCSIKYEMIIDVLIGLKKEIGLGITNWNEIL